MAKEKPIPTIEESGRELDPAVYAGVCAKMKWRPGKRISDTEFKKAVKSFMSAPISGKVKKENTK